MFEPHLGAVGIDAAVFSDPNAQVALEQHIQLLELAAHHSADDFLGLHIGMQIQLSELGAIGYAMMNSPTVKASLENFARYLAAYSRGCHFELRTEGQFYLYDFAYELPGVGVIDRRHEAECTFALILNVVRTLSGTRAGPERVCFEHPRPLCDREHRRIFGTRVDFGCSINRITFRKRLLDCPVATAEPRLFDVIEGHLQRALEEHSHPVDLVNQVRALVARELSNGAPTIDWVADRLALTRRTLQRRLSDHGVGFSEIVDDIRRGMALQYVERSNVPLQEIAFLLGYAHMSAFCRVFRRWTGTTPQLHRNRSRAEPR